MPSSQDFTRRIYNTPIKIALVVACGFVTFLVSLLVTAPFDLASDVAGLIGGTLNVALIYTMTRFFRAEGESAEPRPWWRVTASKPLGWIFGVLYLASAVQTALTATPSVVTSLLVVLHVGFGLLLVVSAVTTPPTAALPAPHHGRR